MAIIETVLVSACLLVLACGVFCERPEAGTSGLFLRKMKERRLKKKLE